MSALAQDINRKLTSENPVIVVNLKEMFDVPFFPESDTLRQSIGQAIIDKITEKTLDGKFLEQSKGAQKYSYAYRESYEFKVYGKSKDKVNLKASGDMLANMSLEFDNDFNKLKILFPDPTEAAKAHGHITGNVGKKRDFFGLTDKELQSIAKEFENDVIDAVIVMQAGAELKQQAAGQGDLDFILQRLEDVSEN